MKTQWHLLVIALFTLACGCSPTSGTATESPLEGSPTNSPTGASPILDFGISEITDAQSFSLAGDPNGILYLLRGYQESLYLARSTNGGQTFGSAVLATGETPVHVLPIEHPALAVNGNGRVDIAWLEMPSDFIGATIWYASSSDGGQTFSAGQSVASESAGEVAMVQIALDEAGNPIVAWLNDSKLRFSRSFDQGKTFSEAVTTTDESCECCQPQISSSGEIIRIAYRGRESGNDKGDIRDILMIHSNDQGRTFEAIARVSDAHWYLPACPIAGPGLAARAGDYFVTWVDGRAEPPGVFTRGDIWFAASNDGGRSFSSNIRVNADESMHNTLPVIAIGPGGRLHFAWEAKEQGSTDTYIHYTWSDDTGQTFAPVAIIADSGDTGRGNPGKPQLVVDGNGRATLGWLDRLGARFATWTDSN
jgi:hypothetical protein